MLPENEKRLDMLAKASEATACPYEIIEYRGRRLLINRNDLKSAINITWERIRDQETAGLTREMGITPRKMRDVIVLQ